MEFENFPLDIIRRILLFVSIEDINSFTYTNKELLKISRDDDFWLLRVKYDHPALNKLSRSWKSTAQLLLNKPIPCLMHQLVKRNYVVSETRYITVDGLSTIRDIKKLLHFPRKLYNWNIIFTLNNKNFFHDTYSIDDNGTIYYFSPTSFANLPTGKLSLDSPIYTVSIDNYNFYHTLQQIDMYNKFSFPRLSN